MSNWPKIPIMSNVPVGMGVPTRGIDRVAMRITSTPVLSVAVYVPYAQFAPTEFGSIVRQFTRTSLLSRASAVRLPFAKSAAVTTMGAGSPGCPRTGGVLKGATNSARQSYGLILPSSVVWSPSPMRPNRASMSALVPHTVRPPVASWTWRVLSLALLTRSCVLDRITFAMRSGVPGG